jgi:hypothetical protein
MTVRNPFKAGGTLAKHFDQVVKCYFTKHRDLIHASGNRNMGNGISGYFWRGYDGVFPKTRWDGSRDTFAYASYRAGEMVAKHERDEEVKKAKRFAHPTSIAVQRAKGF